MSASPHVLPGSRDGFRMGDAKLVDTMIVDGLWDVYNQYHMGTTAENVAKKYEISRKQQDEFAVASQNKAEAAQKAGRFNDEIVPVMIAQRKGDPVAFAQDEFPKAGTTLDSVAGLRPAFAKDGSVTAANASGLNDGAAAVLVMTAERAKSLGLAPLARIHERGRRPQGVGRARRDHPGRAAERTCRDLEIQGWPFGADQPEASRGGGATLTAREGSRRCRVTKKSANGGVVMSKHWEFRITALSVAVSLALGAGSAQAINQSGEQKNMFSGTPGPAFSNPLKIRGL